MNNRVAVITGFYKTTYFLKILFGYLDKQNFKNFDVYIYNTSDTAYEVIENTFCNFSYSIINLKKNSGFAGGNNAAIKEAKSKQDYKYYALINDDTKPTSAWLEELVKTAESNPDAGAISSKMVFYEKFLTVQGETQTASITDSRNLGIRLYENTSFNKCFYKKRFYKKGFYNEEADEINPFRWTDKHFLFELPIHYDKTCDKYELRLFARKNPAINDQYLDLIIGEKKIARINLNPDTIFYTVKIPAFLIENNAHYIIQNAGSGYDDKYNGHDIGNGEIDNGQYNTQHEIKMFCGGACLLTKNALQKTGLFNDHFFSYYEDSDLSLRLKKNGYKILYNPKSLVLHYHSATSKEWSPFFTYHVFRNKIIFAAKNFGMKAFLFALKERSRETYSFLKWNIKANFKNQHLKSRLKLNLLIIKDAVIGIIKYKPGKF